MKKTIKLEDIYGNNFEIEYETDYLKGVGVYRGKITNCPKEFKSKLLTAGKDNKSGAIKQKGENVFAWRENGVDDEYWDIELNATEIDFDTEEIRIYSKNKRVWTKNRLNEKSQKLVKNI